MNLDKNKKQRKFDFVANLINYSINLNRDSNIQIDYSFIKPKDFIKELNEYNEKNPRYLKKGRKKLNGEAFEVEGINIREYPYTHNIASLIEYCVHEIDELNKKVTRFVNGMS